MPWYRREGKIQDPLSFDQFREGMENGKFVRPEHRAFCVLLYYSGIRLAEGLRATRKQFQIEDDKILFDVGVRLKHGIQTPFLLFPLEAPYILELKKAIESTRKEKRVFPYCHMTGYNIVRRAFKYPHYFRLSRITNFFLDNYSIPEVRSWTGLTLRSLDAYVGIVSVQKMGESLAKQKA
jgi:integrase